VNADQLPPNMLKKEAAFLGMMPASDHLLPPIGGNKYDSVKPRKDKYTGFINKLQVSSCLNSELTF
jgi:hypothetical protein